MNEALKIWKMDQKLMRSHKFGEGRPFDEHVLRGYSKSPRIDDLTAKATQRSVTLQSGAMITYLQPRKKTANKFLISLHGGPESYEGTEIRYLGLYRELLRKGWCVIILNYRGSTRLTVHPEKIWKNWKVSVLTDFSEVLENFNFRKEQHEIHLCGVSFGGALALLISQEFQIKSCVLFSPLLDLENQKKRGGRTYSKWFNSRFSKDDLKDFTFENLIHLAQTKCRTLIFCSKKDEVLGNEMNLKLQSYVKKNGKNIEIEMQNTSHNPKSFRTSFFRFSNALKWLTKN